MAGTNGKGSVCAMLDSILRAAGYRVGMFTSPYIRVFHERMRADGELISDGELAEIERIVKPCGLYRMKASSIKEASRMLIEDYSGELPRDMDELLKLPGVGRKIANLILGDVYGLPSVVCDTHCMRICGRFGMYNESLRDPNKIEKILLELLPYGEGSDFCHRIVNFGREVCSSRSPRCAECPVSDLCEHHLKGKR